MKRQANGPILITDASRSQDDQLRSRQVRYVTMMGIRALCLIIGAILVGTKAPLLGLWLPLCAVGMVVIPWLAVLIANDRPPREKHRLSHRLRHPERSPRSLSAESTGEEPPRIIDVDP